MIKAATVEKTDNIDQLLTQLTHYPALAADTLKPLFKGATLAEYKHFLYMMYHYTKDSENKLVYAADHSQPITLQAYFVEMAREERGHYLLALKDLEGFGETVDTNHVPAVVNDFNDFWYKLGSKNCNEFLGALYVFESVAKLVGKEVIDLIMRLNLTKKQSRWLSVHLEADEGHGEEAFNMCAQYMANDPVALMEAAALAEHHWSAVFVEAFSKR